MTIACWLTTTTAWAGCVAADDADDPAIAVSSRTLVINEIAAAGHPDWFEVVNVSARPIQLSALVYVDGSRDLEQARAFPEIVLAPAGRYVQEVSHSISGFRLGSAESLAVYSLGDHRLIDRVEWDDGDSPLDGSFARQPDVTGPFSMAVAATRGRPNDSPLDPPAMRR